MGRRILVSMAIALAVGCTGPLATAPRNAEEATARAFETVRHSPPLLRNFLSAMPKGGELHTHLSGPAYSERYLEWSIEDGLCVDRQEMALASPPCDAAAGRPAVADEIRDPRRRSALLDALSTRNLDGSLLSGHDQFFGSFARFRAVPNYRDGDMLADVVRRAAAENVDYLEVMKTFQSKRARAIAKTLSWTGDYAPFYDQLMAHGLADIVPDATRERVEQEAQLRKLLGCDGPSPEAGCRVTVRFLQQSTRVVPEPQFFAELAFAFLLVENDPHIVGMNIVAPEDDATALADYHDHMRMIGFLAERHPKVDITLHAGELTLGLVPPRELRFHIREAVEVAHARRIGHGVDIGYEDGAPALLRRMAADGILVEVLLTSNDVILGVSGDRHPFPVYWRAGVPLALSTDDEGVSRTDLTNEYQRAAESYGFLGYRDLKRLARNSLAYSFLAGDDLWSDRRGFVPVAACAADPLGAEQPSTTCAALLAASDKAREEWRLEARFARFEAENASER